MKIEIMWLIWMMIGVVWVPLVAPADLVIKIPGKFLTRSLSVAKDGNFHIVKALMKPNIEKKSLHFIIITLTHLPPKMSLFKK